MKVKMTKAKDSVSVRPDKTSAHVSVCVDIGDYLAEVQERWGDEVVWWHYKRSALQLAQSELRRLIRLKLSTEAIQEAMEEWTPVPLCIRKQRTKVSALLAEMKELGKEEARQLWLDYKRAIQQDENSAWD